MTDTIARILTPVGRLVQGSLYDPQTKDMEGRPLVNKAGQPTNKYFFALAIPKQGETHWNQTQWGLLIWNVGHSSFPNGSADSKEFAWKIKDGDSTEMTGLPNGKLRKICDTEGFAGHWILNFSSHFAPAIHNCDGSQQIVAPDFVNLGDYIQVYGSAQSNNSTRKPGVHLNHKHVAFQGYGKRIVLGVNPNQIGFGQAPLPAGVSQTPISGGFNPSEPVAATITPPLAPPAVAAPPPPHRDILQPKPKILTPKAAGMTYEQLISVGWTDALLIQEGYMVNTL